MKFKTFAVFGIASTLAVFGAMADDHKLLVSKAYYAQHLPTVPTVYNTSGTYNSTNDAAKIAPMGALEGLKKATCTQWKPNTNPANSVCYAWTFEDAYPSAN